MGQRWEDVLDTQMDLWRFWHKDPRAKAIADGYLGDRQRMWADLPDVEPDAERGAVVATRTILRLLPDCLYEAEPMWVDPDMMTLIEAAAETFQPEPLVPQDLFSVNGFVYLPRPLYMKDVRGKQVSVRAFTWMPIEVRAMDVSEGLHGIGVALFSSWRDADDYHHGPKPPMDLQLLHVTPWLFNTEYPAAGSGLTETARLIQTLWRVASQTITDRVHLDSTGPYRSRMQKANFPMRKVTVIRLRRPEYIPSGDHHDVEWSHRWIVRPHWRNQWHPGLGIHRQILIPSYVKGPADKPLVVTKRVFELVQ